jgi:hypothetical protein
MSHPDIIELAFEDKIKMRTVLLLPIAISSFSPNKAIIRSHVQPVCQLCIRQAKIGVMLKEILTVTETKLVFNLEYPFLIKIKGAVNIGPVLKVRISNTHCSGKQQP